MFGRRKRARIVPIKTGKALSSRDILVRLRECWGILNPRRPRPLTMEDVELVGYNMKLAELYSEVRALEKDGCGHVGFGGDQSEDDPAGGDDEDETWYYTDVYCGKSREDEK